jgi:hypothetical protein
MNTFPNRHANRVTVEAASKSIGKHGNSLCSNQQLSPWRDVGAATPALIARFSNHLADFAVDPRCDENGKAGPPW